MLAWIIERYPEIAGLPGRKKVEPGLLHRLDYETCGIVLCARSERFFEAIMQASSSGLFEKRYSALCVRSRAIPPGLRSLMPMPAIPGELRSYFRPYGPGRKRVSACDSRSSGAAGPYVTKLLSAAPRPSQSAGDLILCELSLAKGFRHQVRVHLASVGLPIVGDALYGGVPDAGDGLESGDSAAEEPSRKPPRTLRLAATGLTFPHPLTGAATHIDVPSPW